MSEKTLNNIRIVHKHDTEENWLKATNFIPKQGELIIYDIDDTYNYERFKIGNGKTLVSDLPFSNDTKADIEYVDSSLINKKDKDFIVTVTSAYVDDVIQYSADKTYEEIINAIDNGQTVKVLCFDMYFTFDARTEVAVTFSNISLGNRVDQIAIKTDNSVLYLIYGLEATKNKVYSLSDWVDNSAKYPSTWAVKEYVENSISISKADWNQNDPNGDGYIKNRPFYTTFEDMEIYNHTISSVEFSTTSIDGVLKVNKKDKIFLHNIEESKEYTITVNGESITAAATPIAPGAIIYAFGNNSLRSTSMADTGESFCIMPTSSGNNINIYIKADSLLENNTITILATNIEKNIQLNEKYISYKPGLNVRGKTFTIIKDGVETKVIAGEGAEIFNNSDNIATGKYSHAEGNATEASATGSHAEGNNTTASGENSHAEGSWSKASGYYSHAEGGNTTASGMCSHAEGNNTTASGDNSHAEGYYTIAASKYQHVQGKYNIEDTEDKYAHIVGNGDYSSATNYETVQSNAHTVDWSGNAWYQGDIYVGSTSGKNRDEGSKKLATEEYVNNQISSMPEQTQVDWNQNDENTIDYIKNRTHWTEQKLETIAEGQGNFITFLGDDSGVSWDPYLLQSGKEYAIIVDGEKYFVTTYQTWDGFGSYYIGFGDSRLNHYLPVLDEEGNAQFDENGEPIYEQDMRYPSDVPFFCEYICEDSGGSTLSWSHKFLFTFEDGLEHGIKICNILDELEYHQLDEQFIPDTIARVSNIPKQQQVDWNQNDENAPDYIKNRPVIPTEEETLKIFADAGIIELMTDESGEIPTDTDGNIFVF